MAAALFYLRLRHCNHLMIRIETILKDCIRFLAAEHLQEECTLWASMSFGLSVRPFTVMNAAVCPLALKPRPEYVTREESFRYYQACPAGADVF